MTDTIRSIVHDQQNLAKEMANVAIENQKLWQKQVNLAMDNGRASMEMARDLGSKTATVMTDAMLPEKGEA